MIGSKTLMAALAVFFLINPFLPSTAYSRVLSVAVNVDGMACPFCAYGVEKKLKKVSGVGSIDVSGVPGAIRKSGFTPGKIRVTAGGTIKRSDADRFILVFRVLSRSGRMEK